MFGFLSRARRKRMACAIERKSLPLHTLQDEPRTLFNRVHALLYTCAIAGLVYHRLLFLFHATSLLSSFLSLAMLIPELVFAFMWATAQAFRFRPVRRQAFPQRIATKLKDQDFPALDVFVCTADPFKEPPISVVNTVLSVMAFDYPADKISVYVSDDGGSELTLFAFMEAARFAKHWLPFCKGHGLQKRCPQAYFGEVIDGCNANEWENIKAKYDAMKERVERVVERGRVNEDVIVCEDECKAFKKWTAGFTRQDHPTVIQVFTRQDHPTVIQVLVESGKDVDVSGKPLPDLVYLSREKNKLTHHHFKAGALNVLLRVSEVMSNAPVILTLDCDMFCNDPQAPYRALCHLLDPRAGPDLAFVQFPQYFRGINKTDIYHSEYKRVFQMYAAGMDGLMGPNYVGTGAFFHRKAFYSSPSAHCLENSGSNEITDHKPISSPSALTAAHQVSRCTYEQGTDWGSTMGFRYGTLVEDFFTSYRIHCEGWRSVLCDSGKPAFLGNMPVNLSDVLDQSKRWSVGLLEVAFSKYCPLTFGAKTCPLMMAMAYAYHAFQPIWSIPILTYALLPQLTLLNSFSLFPKVSDPWFYLYLYLFLSSYAHDIAEFLIAGGTFSRWWNEQRMWMIKGVSSFLFGFIQVSLKLIGVSAFEFNVTSKVIDDEQIKRYEQEKFEFGVEAPLFIPLSTVAIINLVSFLGGLARVMKHQGHLYEMFAQLFISGFVALNCWPIYEAMVLRKDRGRMPARITIISLFLAWVLYSTASFLLKI